MKRPRDVTIRRTRSRGGRTRGLATAENSMASQDTAPVSLATVPRRGERVGVHRVGGQLLATTPDGALHSFEHDDGDISDVGERIVELADGHRSVRQIAQAVVDEFEVEPDVAERDVLHFVQTLVTKRILTV